VVALAKDPDGYVIELIERPASAGASAGEASAASA
jgi:hypothetical protein